jgi:hypothetical protein
VNPLDTGNAMQIQVSTGNHLVGTDDLALAIDDAAEKRAREVNRAPGKALPGNRSAKDGR